MLEASFDRKAYSNRARLVPQQYGRNTVRKALTVERQSALMIESIKIHWSRPACQRLMQMQLVALEQYTSILSAGSLSGRYFNLFRLRLNRLT